MLEPLPIGLASWIIQDGNYRDFKVGQERSFALEFYAPEVLRPVSAAHPSAPGHVHKADARFAVVGRSVYVDPDLWVMDFGTLAFTSRLPKIAPQAGATLEGSVFLGVDPYDYFERLSKKPGAPALIFDWRIERIEMQTAPFIERSDHVHERDPEKLGWRELTETNAWEDDGGHADYILHCTRLRSEPRRTLSP